MKHRMILWSALAGCLFLSVEAQNQEPRGQLLVQRTTIPNFITDPVLAHNLDTGDVVPTSLPSTFVLTLPSTGQSFLWSPALCRLIGIRKGRSSDFIEIDAEGVHPFSVSLGARGVPTFFGFRFVEGSPEFLYTYGQLSIEERFDITPDGRRLLQRFTISSSVSRTSYTVPETWRKILTADNGRWSQTTLALNPQETKEGFTVTYHLDPEAPRPGLPTTTQR